MIFKKESITSTILSNQMQPSFVINPCIRVLVLNCLNSMILKKFQQLKVLSETIAQVMLKLLYTVKA